jgi:hypothetical protein
MKSMLPAVACAMLLACAGVAHAQRAEPTELQRQAAAVAPAYADLLQPLDLSRPESILRAREAAIVAATHAGPRIADAVFRQFWAFYDRVLWTLLTSSTVTSMGSAADRLLTAACGPDELRCSGSRVDRFLRSTAPADRRLMAELPDAVTWLRGARAAGIAFDLAEGDWYVHADPAFLIALAARLPLGGVREWARFWAAEERQRLSEDGALILTWEELRDRLARWEAFARGNPRLPEVRAEVLPHAAQLLAYYVFGMANTLAYCTGFRDETPTALHVDPALRASYGRFLALNRDSAHYRLVEGIVVRLDKSGGRPTPDLVAFLKAELTDSCFKEWLTTADGWLQDRQPDHYQMRQCEQGVSTSPIPRQGPW